MAPQMIQSDVASRLPESFVEADTHVFTAVKEADSSAWWDMWEDPVLSALLDSALVANLDLRIAAARVMEVQQSHRATRSAQFPGVQLNADGNRQNTPTNLGATGQFSSSIPGFPDRFDVTTYSASLGMSYELDFWGKARASSRAALSQLIATEADYVAARMGVMSEVISTYFEIRDLQQQVRLTEEQVGLLKERLEITEDRYRRGLVSSFEWYSIQQTSDEARAARPSVDAALVGAYARLGVLLGTIPSQTRELVGVSDAPVSYAAPLPDELPSELVLSRPDVIAAAARLESARQAIGVRRAEQFPSFSLTASGGRQSSDLGALVETSQRFWLFGGSLTAPVFAAGARRAAVKMAWAQYEQAAAAYEKAVLTGFQEVSSSLSMFDAEHQKMEAMTSSNASASASYETMRDRYERGVGDYVSLIDARLNELRTQGSISTATRSGALAKLTLYRALGGVWVD